MRSSHPRAVVLPHWAFKIKFKICPFAPENTVNLKQQSTNAQQQLKNKWQNYVLTFPEVGGIVFGGGKSHEHHGPPICCVILSSCCLCHVFLVG